MTYHNVNEIRIMTRPTPFHDEFMTPVVYSLDHRERLTARDYCASLTTCAIGPHKILTAIQQNGEDNGEENAQSTCDNNPFADRNIVPGCVHPASPRQ